MEHCCDYIKQALNDPTVYFDYQPEYRRYYINTESKAIIHQVYFCPWCGTKLPEDLKNKYLEILEKEYHIDDPWDKNQKKLIPKEFKTDEWWKIRKL